MIVPLEVKWVVVILRFLGMKAEATSEYVLLNQPGKQILVEIIWNCVGWQSLVMFLITALVGLQKKFTLVSRIKALVLGIGGTILINILRMVVIVLILRFLGQGITLVFHDYGALISNTLWLFVFWWFSYAFILETKKTLSF